jgi:uncharacterized membrane-anchored protein YhcB (DUF1043 family)
MDVAIDLIVFVFGIAVGAGAMYARFKLNSDTQQTQKELNACQQENAQLKQNWQDHLAEYRSLATNLKEMSAHINGQIEDAEQVLAEQDKGPAFPFFSSEATHILKNANRKKREDIKIDNQPLDYSGSASGLFQGANASETPAEKH